MGIFYCLYKINFNKRRSIDLYKKKFLKYKVLAKIILNKDMRFILAF